MSRGGPRKPVNDLRTARLRAQWRNRVARRYGRPEEPVPEVPGLTGRTFVSRRPTATPETWAQFVDYSAGLDGCWPWLGNCKPDDGYGRLRVDGVIRTAHRFSLEQALGRPLGPGLCALHHCDNPPCVNPAHLYEGTQLDNVRDAIQRGRARRMTPILEPDIWDTVARLEPHIAASAFGVSLRTIYRTRARARSVAA